MDLLAVEVPKEARDARCLKPLGAKDVGRSPRRRHRSQLEARVRPAFGGGDRGEALAGARLPDHHDDALADSEQAVDHLALVVL